MDDWIRSTLRGLRFKSVNENFSAKCGFFSSKILHKHCFQFFLGLTIAPPEINANFWRERCSHSYSSLRASLLLSSKQKKRRVGSAWITSILWSRRSRNFWTSQSCFLPSNWFTECEHLFTDKPTIITELAVLSARLLDLSSKFFKISRVSRFFSIHAESLSTTPKSSKRKKLSSGELRWQRISVERW